MSAADKVSTFFCRTCQEYFEDELEAHPVEGHNAATCPTCQTEGLSHCPECGAPVENAVDKRCPSCTAAYVG